MSISQEQPNYKSFVRNEIKTLQFMGNQSVIAGKFHDLTTKAHMYNSVYQGVGKRVEKLSIKFECELELLLEYKKRRVFIGANLLPNYSLASYMFAVCDGNGNSKDIIRKFHFDYAIPIKGEDPKPVYHLQYGGVASPLLKNEEISCARLQPEISNPRLHSSPMNLALLLDSLFCEFRSESTEKIIASPEWRKLIKENEELLLKPYFGRVKEFLWSNDYSSDRLLRDFQYGG